jgi:hypothetical protein
MKTAVAIENQTMLDIALQYCGDADGALETAIANGLSLTDSLSPGQTLTLPEIPANRAVASYYGVNGIKPATGTTQDDTPPGGISFMGIQIDFIVS